MHTGNIESLRICNVKCATERRHVIHEATRRIHRYVTRDVKLYNDNDDDDGDGDGDNDDSNGNGNGNDNDDGNENEN